MEIDVVTEQSIAAAEAVNNIFSNIAVIDLLACFFLTIPIFIAYLVCVFLYFKKIDKPVNEKTHGLSRFALGGVLLIFAMIIVDMNVEFVSAMIISLNKYKKLNLEELKPVLDSIFFINFIEHYRKIPFDILVMGNIFCTALYAGAEGLVSSLKTLKVPEGMSIELPFIKRKRLKFIFLVWCATAILASIYTIIIGSEEIEFEVSLCYAGVISTLIILILADRSPSVLENFTAGKTKDVTEVNMANEVAVDLSDEVKKNEDDALDHVTDVAVKVLKKLNPELSDSDGGDL